MVPRKLRIRVALFCYAGNGMYSSIHPAIASWLADTKAEFDADERVSVFDHVVYSDTPITMTRNLSVVEARRDGVDVLVMVDSDQFPDYHLDRPGSKRFMPSSFNYLYERYERGPNVVLAPYCMGPPKQVVAVFDWANWTDEHPDQDMRLVKFGRKEAAKFGGIQECAAGPTGLSMFDMRIFDITEPADIKEDWKGWFYYEYTNKYACEKGSTEDVAATRDMSLMGIEALGYNPMHCNWDAWAGHWKPLCVGKPIPIVASQVSSRFREGAKNNFARNEQLVTVGDEDVERGHIAPPFDDMGISVNSEEDIACLKKLVKMVQQGTVEAAKVVEIGSWLGSTAIAMADAGAEVTCVDMWKDFGSSADIISALYRAHGEKVYQTFLRNIGTRKDRTIFPVRTTSQLAATERWHKDEQFDLVFIDANHDYDAVHQDIRLWFPRVREGGILCGHDFSDGFPGVMKAVRELFDDFTVEGSVWWVRKAESQFTREFEEDVPELIASGY